jgi:prepilin-type N-terminal cleavage/methylation domain-containing protein
VQDTSDSGAHDVQPRRTPRPAWHDEVGLTLIELMVAIFILGVLLSATAASLITFSRQAAFNERRVQATALLNELHEQLQTAPWDRVALYEDEIAPLGTIGANLAVDPPTFEGNELVLLDAPDDSTCATPSPGCARDPLVPYAQPDVGLIDGREYEVLQAITWVDRSGDGNVDVKRFTTIVRWTVLGKTSEQRFDSERAPRAADIVVDEPLEIVQFNVTPEQAVVDDVGLLTDSLAIVARFDRGITAAEVNYTTIDADGAPLSRTLPLTPTLWQSARPIAFSGSIPAGTEFFEQGPFLFELTGFDGLDSAVGTTSVEFVPVGLSPPPEVTQVTRSKGSVNVGSSGANTGKLQCALTIRARVDGLDVGGTVTLNYTSIVSEGITMSAETAITGSGDWFQWTFPNNSTSVWSAPTSEIFQVIARTSDGRTSATMASETVQFASSNSGC